MILTAGKGVSLVVMDTEEYKKKSEELLQQPTYKSIPTDPMTRYKNKLINLLKTIKAEGGINEALYKRLYPTGAGSPKFYAQDTQGRDAIKTYSIQYRGSHLCNIQRISYDPQTPGRKVTIPSPEYPGLHSTNIQGIKLQSDQCMVSYDVKALFTSVPIQPGINIIKKLLDEDKELQQRTTMTVNNITCLLKFYLKSTYFTFQGKHYEQLEGAAMGSPISHIVANLYMENFEVKAISTAPHLLISGREMLMTPSPSSSHHREGLSWITSIPLTSIYNLLVKTKEKMDPCLP